MLKVGTTWSEWWYLGPTIEHHRCYSVFTNSTQAEHTSDMVELFPQKLQVPFLSANDIAVRATTELVQVLQSPQPANPFLSAPNNSRHYNNSPIFFRTPQTRSLPKFRGGLSQSFTLSLCLLRGCQLRVVPSFRGWKSVLLHWFFINDDIACSFLIQILGISYSLSIS